MIADTVIRVKDEEVVRLMRLRGIRFQAELARRAELHPQHLSKILNHLVEPTITTVDRICQALDCEIMEILERAPDDPQTPED